MNTDENRNRARARNRDRLGNTASLAFSNYGSGDKIEHDYDWICGEYESWRDKGNDAVGTPAVLSFRVHRNFVVNLADKIEHDYEHEHDYD